MKWNLIKEEGFTLLEALVALMLSSMILLLLSAGITQSTAIRNVLVNDSEQVPEGSKLIRGDRQIEWHMFLNQLENYLEGTKNPQVSAASFKVDEWDEEDNRYHVVSYLRRGAIENFTRSKNNGNNRMLTGIEDVHFERQDGWLLLNFKFRTGEEYLGRIWTESWVEEEEGNEKEPEDGEEESDSN